MPIQYVTGDIFINTYAARALAHGCNCQGSMGAGVAKGFKERYPAMFAEYRRLCTACPRKFNLGDIFLWKEAGKPWVFNLATQEGYWHARASYEAIQLALENMRCRADAEEITSIAMPQIGSGYGGLSWKKVKLIIEETFSTWEGTLYVYEKYVPGE